MLNRWLFLLILSLTFSPSLYAADSMSVTSMEVKTTGNVSSGNLLKPGQMAFGLLYQQNYNPVPTEVLGSEAAKGLSEQKLVKQINQMTAVFALGIAKFLELNIGVHGTQEILDQDSKRQLYSNEEFQQNEGSKNSNADETGFAGISALAKIRVVDRPGLKFALAPFLKSGAGETARYSVSRSENASGGWMAIGTYGARGIAEINLNGGYRYRERERIGEWNLRNEAFYQASIEAFLNPNFSIFTSALGRKLKVAKDEEQVAGQKREYVSVGSGEFTAGIGFDYKGFKVSAYGGSKIQQGLGSGGPLAGINLGYTFKNRSATAPSSDRYMADDDSEESRAAEEQKSVEKWDPKVANETKPEEYENIGGGQFIDMDGKKGKLYEDLDKKPKGASKDYSIPEDDFSVFEKQMKKKVKSKKGPTEDEVIEKELTKLREAEAKTAKAAEKARIIEERNRRSQLKKDAAEDNKNYRKFRKDIREETEELPEVTDEEVSWDGLED